MTPIKPNKPENPKNPEPKTVNAASPTVGPAPAVAPAPEAASKPEKSSNKSNRDGKRILSVAIPEKLARQVRLLCSVTGVSAQELVEAALRRAVNKQLGAALDAIKPDVES